MSNNEPSIPNSITRAKADSQPGSQSIALGLNERIAEFLQEGWVYCIDGDRLLLGTGPMEPLAKPPARKLPQPASCALYMPDFYLECPRPWKVATEWIMTTRAALIAALETIPQADRDRQKFQWFEPQLADFESKMQEIWRGMNERGLQKAVPVVFECAKFKITTAQRSSMLQSLLRLPRTLSVYGAWSETEGVMGVTPEVLYKLRINFDGARLETMALAGTRAKRLDEDGAALLLADPKERREHQLVIDDLRAVLADLGDVIVGDTVALELPTLFHLKTSIEVVISDTLRPDDLAKLLHPTPALGVSPRRLGFAEMKRWDDDTMRGSFGAPFGVEAWLDDGTCVRECLVAIRSLRWKDERVAIGSGCGIVSGSETAREWNELKLKRESVKRMLSL